MAVTKAAATTTTIKVQRNMKEQIRKRNKVWAMERRKKNVEFVFVILSIVFSFDSAHTAHIRTQDFT